MEFNLPFSISRVKIKSIHDFRGIRNMTREWMKVHRTLEKVHSLEKCIVLILLNQIIKDSKAKKMWEIFSLYVRLCSTNFLFILYHWLSKIENLQMDYFYHSLENTYKRFRTSAFEFNYWSMMRQNCSTFPSFKDVSSSI